MVEQLLNHIHRHELCKTTDKILLAVSGGIDSMVMLHLFRQAGFDVGVAHCNFQLRGDDSLADEALVAQECATLGVPFHHKRFDTGAYAVAAGLSIQMAARQLRYDFFDTLLHAHGYVYLATAHHLNDVLETTILNLVKGTGMDGLQGVPVKNGSIIRPLLFATKEMLVAYARLHRLQWREDVSNASEDYQRNFIRHQVIPRLKELNPGLEHTYRSTNERITASVQFARNYIDSVAAEAITTSDSSIIIRKKEIDSTASPAVMLWELIKDKGFNFAQCQEIVTDHQSGKKFFSSTHELFTDREAYILQEKSNTHVADVTIEAQAPLVSNGHGELHFDVQTRSQFTLSKDPLLAQLDLDKITYPLVWRCWQHGDSFVPLGMQHSKKLSDFFIDLKIPLPEKEKITVLESAGVIVWVVGLRIHDHYKITAGTSRILTVQLNSRQQGIVGSRQ
ncbi:tRNA lysidine(34) synthetase TilS [Fulvivirgaceae bacterium PWU4]|uniref:tRNA(Ile)-lysidine synthase n=1 Tax=Chryseosolibacter histidini TaxID=2782349 RepID=A0AAP2GJG2_9BACT|nr:tRNA lysidine(34) synthetase TilS [Chryseosolibacter histidini]MBT1697989.1 tRNA lysidine(34) synthetase TilS [Chryseosolibacter histidini]